MITCVYRRKTGKGLPFPLYNRKPSRCIFEASSSSRSRWKSSSKTSLADSPEVLNVKTPFILFLGRFGVSGLFLGTTDALQTTNSSKAMIMAIARKITVKDTAISDSTRDWITKWARKSHRQAFMYLLVTFFFCSSSCFLFLFFQTGTSSTSKPLGMTWPYACRSLSHYTARLYNMIYHFHPPVFCQNNVFMIVDWFHEPRLRILKNR